MKSRILILFFLISYVSVGQTIAPYQEADFPANKFITKKEQQTLGTISVNIIQVRPKKEADSRIPCRTWLTIKDGNKTIKELSQDMEALGGCSGYYFPDKQPAKNLIVISKFGDYDGRLLIIDHKGELKDYLGGKFYVSADHRYLFSNYDSDLSGTTIIDLTKNELIFTEQLKQYLADWYYQDGQYYSLISDDVIIDGETGQLVFDFLTNDFKEKRTKDKIDPDKKLKVYNDPLIYPNCNCGN
jgi:hypothetical protein